MYTYSHTRDVAFSAEDAIAHFLQNVRCAVGKMPQ